MLKTSTNLNIKTGKFVKKIHVSVFWSAKKQFVKIAGKPRVIVIL